MEVKPLFFDSYISVIKNSIESKTFQTFWAEVDGEKKDITKGGLVSCAVFVTAILLWSGLIKDKHATISSTVKDMLDFGWKEISEVKEGAVIRWEEKEIEGSMNEHIGFYMGDEEAISNSSEERVPKKHHWTYNDTRKVVAIYWHPRLNDKYF